MDVLTTDGRFGNVSNFHPKDANGNAVGFTRLVDTINASEIVRDQFNALTKLSFQVHPTTDPTKPQAAANANGLIEIFLSPGALFNPDVLISADAGAECA